MSNSSDEWNQIAVRHLFVGWWGVVLFMALGVLLESLHGLKLGYYLSVDNETRRFMWTLAHAHGTLFSLLQAVFGLTIKAAITEGSVSRAAPRLASNLSLFGWATVPVGFFLGGLWFYGGDPGPGIFLVPIGAFAILFGVALFSLTLPALFRGDALKAREDSPAEKSRAKGRRRKRS